MGVWRRVARFQDDRMGHVEPAESGFPNYSCLTMGAKILPLRIRWRSRVSYEVRIERVMELKQDSISIGTRSVWRRSAKHLGMAEGQTSRLVIVTCLSHHLYLSFVVTQNGQHQRGAQDGGLSACHSTNTIRPIAARRSHRPPFCILPPRSGRRGSLDLQAGTLARCLPMRVRPLRDKCNACFILSA